MVSNHKDNPWSVAETDHIKRLLEEGRNIHADVFKRVFLGEWNPIKPREVLVLYRSNFIKAKELLGRQDSEEFNHTYVNHQSTEKLIGIRFDEIIIVESISEELYFKASQRLREDLRICRDSVRGFELVGGQITEEIDNHKNKIYQTFYCENTGGGDG